MDLNRRTNHHLLDFDHHVLDNLYKNDIQIITKEDNIYPQKLKYIKCAPPVLFLKGNINLLSKFSIAIVGSRNCSEYGKNVSEMFKYEKEPDPIYEEEENDDIMMSSANTLFGNEIVENY